MNLTALYRAGMYVMLGLATLILSVDASSYISYAMAYPVIVALAGAAAFATVDRNPALGLPRDLANFLALGSFLLAIMEYWQNESALLLAMGHWLVYLQLIKMFLPKSVEDDWFLFILGLVQVVVGVYISQSEQVGVLLYAWAIASLWSLGLFHLHRESQRNRQARDGAITPAPDPKRPYPGLINASFMVSTGLVTLSTLVLGSLIFWLMPRWSEAVQREGGAAPRHLTGFSDQVRLGQIGEILENDRIVMTVELFDSSGRTVTPNGEPLWRGATHSTYQTGRWTRRAPIPISLKEVVFPRLSSPDFIHQKIKLELTGTDALFALRPVFGVKAHRLDQIALNIEDGTLLRHDPDTEGTPQRKGSAPKILDYEVISAVDPTVPQFRDDPPAADSIQPFLELPLEVEAELRANSERILGGMARATAEERARALERYLRDSGEFFYTLRMESSGQLDPVVHFLTVRKEGHCEYFASALALLLRAADIPSRLVNGFKGGDWNGLVRALNVREKHAHSWVEALVGEESAEPRWIVLDPTPATERARVVARVGASPWRVLLDALRHIWLFNIVGFDHDRQERLIYGPVRQLANEATQGFGVINRFLGRWLGRFFVFQTPGELFSLRGFVVSVSLMLIVLGFLRLFLWILRRVVSRLRGLGRGATASASDVPFFQRLLALLSRIGLERASSETPREFAARASKVIGERHALLDGLGEVPPQVVEAFYQVRFGHEPLDAETSADLAARLDALEASFHSA
jgi:transglutaminase-like putative cysteine protease